MSEQGNQFDVDFETGGVPRGEGDSLEEAGERLRRERDPEGEVWREQAESNIEKWGNQEVGVLLLASAEELAEAVDAYLETATPGEGMVSATGRRILATIRDTGFLARDLLESEYETNQGHPLPDDDAPRLAKPGSIDSDAVADEVHDLAPLIYQLVWALEEVEDAN